MSPAEPESAAERMPIATVRLTRPVTVRTIAVAVVVFFVAAYTFGWLRAAIRGQSFEPIVISASATPTVVDWLALSIGLAALVAVHEVLHGIVLRRYGGSPSYGVGVSKFLLPYAYAGTDATSYTRNQLLVALLTPVVVITAIGLVAMAIASSTLLVVALAANAAGSVSDLRMAAVLAQYPASVRIAEHPESKTGAIAIYATGGERVDGQIPAAAVLTSIVTGSVATLVLTTITLGALVFHSLVVSTGDVVVGTDRWLLFRHQLDAGRTAHLELGGRLLGALALGGGLGWTLAGRLWRSIVGTDDPGS